MSAPKVYAGVWRAGTDPHYLWSSDWTGFRAKWEELSAQGLRLVDLKVRGENGATEFVGTWRAGTDAHYLWVNATWPEFEAKWKELSPQGLRLTTLEVYDVGGQPRFAGVWRAGTDAHYLWVGAAWAKFCARWEELGAQGLRLVDLEVYAEGGHTRYAGVWRAGTDGHYLWAGATWPEFRDQWEARSADGLRLVDLEIYDAGGQTRYAGVWRAGGDAHYLLVKTDWDDFVAKRDELAAQGLRLTAVETYRDTGLDVDAWLAAHPAVANGIIWETRDGAQAWPSWSDARKSDLRHAFDLARTGRSIAVAEVPPNQAHPADDEYAETVLRASDAWAYYTASVAQSLAQELRGRVRWSVLDYTAAQRAQLFDSREMFSLWFLGDAVSYRIDRSRGHAVPAPPALVDAFLAANGLVAKNRPETLARVLGWCRLALVHYLGDAKAANMEDQWQYRGLPPTARVLSGTPQTSGPASGVQHRTAGCWGTTALLRVLLRVVNIPVKQVTAAGHTQPWFMADGCYLSHGDDPYNQLSSTAPGLPPGELLISQATYDAWFGPGVSDADKANNVGRRTRELALTYLPNYVLHAYCRDTAAGKSHAGGEVFATFAPNYTVAQLEAQQLWQRMDARLATLGGCAHVP